MHNHTCPSCNNVGRIHVGEATIFCGCSHGTREIAREHDEQRASDALVVWNAGMQIVRTRSLREAA